MIDRPLVPKWLTLTWGYLSGVGLLNGYFLKLRESSLHALGNLCMEFYLLAQECLHVGGQVVHFVPVELIDLGKGDVTDDLSAWRHLHQRSTLELLGPDLKLLVGLNRTLLDLHNAGHLLKNALIQLKAVKQRVYIMLGLLTVHVSDLAESVAQAHHGGRELRVVDRVQRVVTQRHAHLFESLAEIGELFLVDLRVVDGNPLQVWASILDAVVQIIRRFRELVHALFYTVRGVHTLARNSESAEPLSSVIFVFFGLAFSSFPFRAAFVTLQKVNEDLALANNWMSCHAIEPELQLSLSLCDELVVKVARDGLARQWRYANVRILFGESLVKPVEVIVAAFDSLRKNLMKKKTLNIGMSWFIII